MLLRAWCRIGCPSFKLFLSALTVAIAVTTFPASGRADSLVFKDRAVVGRIRTFSQQSLTYSEGCAGQQVKTIPWVEVSAVAFDHDCALPKPPTVAHHFALCATGLDVFIVKFKGIDTPIVAERAALAADGQVHLDLLEPWEQAHGPSDAVASVSRATICPGQILGPAVYPSEYCHESRQVAVAFDYGTPLNNKILTNGFSFTLRTSGAVPKDFDREAFGHDVRNAFQTAITLWTAAMADRPLLLTNAVRDFLRARTAESGRYRLLTPPQVIQLKCPQAAVFVVELSFAEDQLFPRFPLVLARARIEGRTIALNMRASKCFRSELKFDENKRLGFEAADGCINMIPIFAHELGHAFGLHHLDNADRVSLMDSRFSRDALTPTDADVVALVRALERSITGSNPGVLEFVSTSGVLPPLDWRPPD